MFISECDTRIDMFFFGLVGLGTKKKKDSGSEPRKYYQKSNLNQNVYLQQSFEGRHKSIVTWRM